MKKALLKKQITKARTWRKKARALHEYSKEIHTHRHRHQPEPIVVPSAPQERCKLCDTPYGNLFDLEIKANDPFGIMNTEHLFRVCNDCYRWLINTIQARSDVWEDINGLKIRIGNLENESKGL